MELGHSPFQARREWAAAALGRAASRRSFPHHKGRDRLFPTPAPDLRHLQLGGENVDLGFGSGLSSLPILLLRCPLCQSRVTLLKTMGVYSIEIIARRKDRALSQQR